jgi:hypothetical protein
VPLRFFERGKDGVAVPLEVGEMPFQDGDDNLGVDAKAFAMTYEL